MVLNKNVLFRPNLHMLSQVALGCSLSFLTVCAMVSLRGCLEVMVVSDVRSELCYLFHHGFCSRTIRKMVTGGRSRFSSKGRKRL